MDLWTYSPEDVQVLLGGVQDIVGFVDGTFVNVSKDVVPFTMMRTTDGMVARKYVNDQTYSITISIMSMSPSNDILTRLWQIDEATRMGKFPLLIKDSKGTGIFFSSTTWVEKLPDLSYSSSPEIRQWLLRSSQGLINIGGNDEESVSERILTLAASGIPLIQQTLQNLTGGL